MRRWVSLSEVIRKRVVMAVKAVRLHSDWREELVPQLRRALRLADVDWHTGIDEGGSGGPGALASFAEDAEECWQEAAAACEGAAALLAAEAQTTSQALHSPLDWLAMANIGGAPVKVSVPVTVLSMLPVLRTDDMQGSHTVHLHSRFAPMPSFHSECGRLLG